eukprot:jgi/Botrbrau1/22606/Bobra.176_1s0036.1
MWKQGIWPEQDKIPSTDVLQGCISEKAVFKRMKGRNRRA